MRGVHNDSIGQLPAIRLQKIKDSPVHVRRPGNDTTGEIRNPKFEIRVGEDIGIPPPLPPPVHGGGKTFWMRESRAADFGGGGGGADFGRVARVGDRGERQQGWPLNPARRGGETQGVRAPLTAREIRSSKFEIRVREDIGIPPPLAQSRIPPPLAPPPAGGRHLRCGNPARRTLGGAQISAGLRGLGIVVNGDGGGRLTRLGGAAKREG